MKPGPAWECEVWLIDDLLVDTRTRSASRRGESIELPPLSYDFLLTLAEAAPSAVSADELMKRVWKGVVVSPATIAKRAELLRQALGDDPANPRYVALVRGHGYRLLHIPKPAPEPGRQRRWALAIGGLTAALACVLVVVWLWLDLTAPGSGVAEKSIAVLPFADLSESNDQEWFADGLAEEILNALVRVPDLRVAARSSSFRFRGSDKSVRGIGRELGVAHVLEGSVRSSAGRIRVTAQLIRAADGFHLWSQNYDRDAVEVISIQEDLALEIAAALQTSMDPEALADMSKVGTQSVEAYHEYLQGLKVEQFAGTSTRERDEFKQAYRHFERARSIDPDFFSAHVKAAEFWVAQLSTNTTVANLTEFEPLEMLSRYHERVSAATRSVRSPSDRMLLMARQAEVELRLNEALELYESYLAQRPNDDAARYSAIYTAVRGNRIAKGRRLIDAWMERGMGDYDAARRFSSSGYLVMDPGDAAELVLRALRNWPDDAGLLYQAHRTLLWAGREAEASDVAARYRVIAGDSASPVLEMRDACAQGDRSAAQRILREFDSGNTKLVGNSWLMNNLLGNDQAIIDLLAPLEESGVPYQLAALLAFKQFDPSPFPSIVAILSREGIDRPPPVVPPFACPPDSGHLF